MKNIQLSADCIALVDDEDFAFISQWKWKPKRFKNTVYARAIDINGRYILMHRIILALSDRNIIIDHKDRNGLNNTRENLRICNRSQNRANSSAWGKSKYLGVTINNGKYVAKIYTQRFVQCLGRFPLTKEGEIAAAIAYNKAALEKYGDFANLNTV